MFSQNNEEKKLDWMYKGPTATIDREEYLLGRSIDKSLDQLNAAEKQAQSSSKPIKNHVEHECIPPSIRDFKKMQLGEQVDIAQKLQEDPLVAIKKREEETRLRLLQNPVQLKKLQKVLKLKKEKKKKKSKKSKKHSDSSDSEARLDKKLQEKYASMCKQGPSTSNMEEEGQQQEEDLDKILIKKFMQFKHLLTKSDLDEILNMKEESSDEANNKKNKTGGNKYYSSSEEEDTRETRDKKPRRSRSRSPNRNRNKGKFIPKNRETNNRRYNRRDSSGSDSETHLDNYSTRKRNNLSRESGDKNKNYDNRNRDLSNRYHENRNSENRRNHKIKESRKDSNRSRERQKARHESESDSSSSSSSSSDSDSSSSSSDSDDKRKKSKKREKSSKRKQDSSESEDKHKKKKKKRDSSEVKKDKSKTKHKRRNSSSSSERDEKHSKSSKSHKDKKSNDSKNVKSKTKHDSSDSEEEKYSKKRKALKPELPKPNEVDKTGNYESDDDRPKHKKNFGLVRADGTKIHLPKHSYTKEETRDKKQPQPVTQKPYEKQKRKKLTEEEIEQRRKEMMENAEWRDKERERNVKRYRENEAKETKNQDYKPEFLTRELLKSANNSTVESRIKSNINNIQRSGKDMSSHFSRRY